MNVNRKVTILILIDGFLQSEQYPIKSDECQSHNPYFNRWFSAIASKAWEQFTSKFVTILILIDGFLQYI